MLSRALSLLAGRAGLRDRRGVVSIEFAVIAPATLIMVVGAFDVGRAVVAWQETQEAAQNISFAAESLADSAETTNSSNLTVTTAQYAMTEVYAIIPDTYTHIIGGQYSVTLSGVQYQNGNAYITWSVPLSKGNTAYMQTYTRACGETTQVSNLPDDNTTLQVVSTKSITVNSPYVIADVYYQFKPMFFEFITGDINFWATYLTEPTSGSSVGGAIQTVTYEGQNTAYSGVCANSPPS